MESVKSAPRPSANGCSPTLIFPCLPNLEFPKCWKRQAGASVLKWVVRCSLLNI